MLFTISTDSGRGRMKTIQKVYDTYKLLGFSRSMEFARLSLRQPNPIRPWETDGEFVKLAGHIEGRTLISRTRAFMLYQMIQQALAVPGEIAEIGVYRGGTAWLLCKLAGPERLVYLFDTFEGMPAVDKKIDFHREGDFADTSLEAVREFLKEFSTARFHKGYFPGTAEPVKEKRFAFVHVDVDIYPSVLSCCEFFYPRMNRGGIMMFDDYGFITCPGAKKAVDEFFQDKPEKAIYLQSGQCMAIKI
jgi:O-methyltransferase